MPLVQMHHGFSNKEITNADTYENEVSNLCNFSEPSVELMMHQQFIRTFMAPHTPYNGLLVYHSVGTGKTLTSIAVSESYLDDRENRGLTTLPVIVIASRNLHHEFMKQLYDPNKPTYTGEKYMTRLLAADPSLKGASYQNIKNKLNTLIKSRYEFYGYNEFLGKLEETPEAFQNRLVIIDEAHNMRQSDADKEASIALDKLSKHANNKIILMTATPMYNESSEIVWLLSILLQNDKRTDEAQRLLDASRTMFLNDGALNPTFASLLQRYAGQYISYVRGNNPFTFPVKLSASKIIGDENILRSSSSNGWRGSAIHDRMWPAYLPDIVPCPLSKSQKAAISSIKTKNGNDQTNITTLNQELAYNNIVFRNTTAQHESAFHQCFSVEPATETSPLKISYVGKEQFLSPGLLAESSPKMAKIIDMSQDGEGIVLIYSQYIWGGIIPMAIALEHMGYENCDRNILSVAGKRTAKKGSYVIICGNKTFTPSIPKAIQAVNDKNNQNGQRIKYVLISQVASEGVSFRNVREVHVLDPWYHYNRIEQIIGRAVRTCSHVSLPLSKRNVSIFLYASYDKENETADMYTYRLAAGKRREILEIEKLIRRSSIDCSLHMAKNYYPENLFQGMNKGFEMITSQGSKVQVTLGDPVTDQFDCIVKPDLKKKKALLRAPTNTNAQHGQKKYIRVLNPPH